MNKPFIILEGPDGVGKSTHLNFLAQMYKQQTTEYNNKHDNSYQFWFAQLSLAHVDAIGRLWSRSFLSERIYADVFERTPRLTCNEEAHLVKVAQAFDAEIIIVLPKDEEVTYKRLVARGDYKVVLQKWKTILERYKAIAARYDLKVIYI